MRHRLFCSIFENAMAEKIEVKGYEEFKTTVNGIAEDREINVLFEGAKTDTGVSWCPDCTEAEPFIMSALEAYGKVGSAFLIVDVGDRAFWKDMQNPFRSDKDIAIKVLPSLIRWKGPQRLEGVQCLKADLLEMFFTDE